MSRSNPHQNAPNPAVKFFEWNGEQGVVRYYDKAKKENVTMPLPFTFLLLDEVASVRGWHEPSSSGIYSNEVRDTRKEPFVVKAFKGGTLAEGLYKAIKDRVNTLGGGYVANCYIAFKNGSELAIASLKFKGAALGAWMEARKQFRGDLFEQAIDITGFTEGKKGRVIFRVPTFSLRAVSPDTNAAAVALDKQLQDWLKAYFARRTNDQAEAAPAPEAETDAPPPDDFDRVPTDDDIPF